MSLTEGEGMFSLHVFIYFAAACGNCKLTLLLLIYLINAADMYHSQDCTNFKSRTCSAISARVSTGWYWCMWFLFNWSCKYLTFGVGLYRNSATISTYLKLTLMLRKGIWSVLPQYYDVLWTSGTFDVLNHSLTFKLSLKLMTLNVCSCMLIWTPNAFWIDNDFHKNNKSGIDQFMLRAKCIISIISEVNDTEWMTWRQWTKVIWLTISTHSNRVALTTATSGLKTTSWFEL